MSPYSLRSISLEHCGSGSTFSQLKEWDLLGTTDPAVLPSIDLLLALDKLLRHIVTLCQCRLHPGFNHPTRPCTWPLGTQCIHNHHRPYTLSSHGPLAVFLPAGLCTINSTSSPSLPFLCGRLYIDVTIVFFSIPPFF